MNNNFYKQLIEESSIGYAYHKIICDDHGSPCDYEFIEVNAAFERFTGLICSDIVGRKITEILPDITKSDFDNIRFYGDIAINGGKKEFELFSQPLNKWYRVNVYSPEKNYFLTHFIDISIQKDNLIPWKNKDKELTEAKLSMKGILDNLPFLAWLKDEKGIFIEVNREFQKACGKSVEEIIGHNDYDIWTTELAEKYTSDDLEVIHSGKAKCVEELVVHMYGDIWFETFKTPIFDVDGKVIGTIGIARDISERKKLELEIENDKRFLNSIIDAIPDVIFFKDRNSKYLGCNKSFAEKVAKCDKKTVQGKGDFDYFNDSVANLNVRQDKEIMDSQESQFNYVTLKTAHGIVEYETIKTPFYNENGVVIGVIGISRDITVRKCIEEKLRLSEEKFRLLFENMTNCFSLQEVILNDEGEAVDFRYLMVNKAYEILMNQPFEEIIGKSILEINPAADKELIQKYCKVGLTGEPLRLEYFSKTTNQYFETFIYSTQKGLFASVLEDVTKRKEMENSLKESEERFRQAHENFRKFFDSVEDLLFVIDAQGKITHVNNTVCNRLGYSEEELIGESVLIVHPENRRGEVESIVNDILSGKVDYSPIPAITKYGQEIPMETRITIGRMER